MVMDSHSICCQSRSCSERSKRFSMVDSSRDLLPNTRFRLSRDFWSTKNFSLKFPGRMKQQSFPAPNYPLKTLTKPGNGLKLSIQLNKNLNSMEICTTPSFTVHSPYELPGISDSTDILKFDFGFELEVLITPEIIRTDEALRSYDPKERGCYFPGERRLKFFKVYTRRNCEFECFSDKLKNDLKLNCTPYYVVRDETTVICDFRQELLSRQQSYYALRDVIKCNCLDECNSIKYNIEIFQHNLLNNSEATMEFKFKDVDIVPLRRYQPFTFSEFLAQSGGMLGLFAGISMLSIVELCYFLSLRWIVNCWRWLTSSQ
jgi:acid-sensing ion channel, other